MSVKHFIIKQSNSASIADKVMILAAYAEKFTVHYNLRKNGGVMAHCAVKIKAFIMYLTKFDPINKDKPLPDYNKLCNLNMAELINIRQIVVKYWHAKHVRHFDFEKIVTCGIHPQNCINFMKVLLNDIIKSILWTISQDINLDETLKEFRKAEAEYAKYQVAAVIDAVSDKIVAEITQQFTLKPMYKVTFESFEYILKNEQPPNVVLPVSQ